MMEHFNSDDDDRGQVGIGTLIVFIAMVLVAAIAAGVLINTAGFLQSQSEETGEQSSQQVTDRVEVTSSTAETDGSGDLETIDLDIKRAPGAGDIDLTQVTIHWVGPSGVNDMTVSSSEITPISESTSNNIIDADSEMYTIEVPQGTDTDGSHELTAGDSTTMDITTASGGTTSVTISVPETLPTNGAVDL